MSLCPLNLTYKNSTKINLDRLTRWSVNRRWMVLILQFGVCESISENMKVVEQIFKYNKSLIQFKINTFN